MTPDQQKSLDELLPLCRLQAIMWVNDDVLLHPLPWHPAKRKAILDGHLDQLVEDLLAGGTPAAVVLELNSAATAAFDARLAEIAVSISPAGRA